MLCCSGWCEAQASFVVFLVASLAAVWRPEGLWAWPPVATLGRAAHVLKDAELVWLVHAYHYLRIFSQGEEA